MTCLICIYTKVSGASLKDVFKIASDNGIIIASTNNVNFEMRKFKTFIDKAFKETNTRYKILEQHQMPEDFAVPHYFKDKKDEYNEI